SLTFSNADTSDSGSQFRVVVTNSAGSATSNPATLTVNSEPTITVDPQDANVLVGETATFSITAFGNPNPGYQWQAKVPGATDFDDIPGATGTSYITAAATADDNGTEIRCMVTNS